MKRSLICLILAVVLCVGGVTGAALAVNDRRDQVTYTETIHLGNPDMVEGLTVTSEIELMDQLFWTVEHRPGSAPRTETEYRYFSSPQERPRFEDPVGIALDNDFYTDLDVEAELSELSGLRLAMRELYERTPVGEERSERIKLSDYYEFYPIGMSLYLQSGMRLGGWSSDYVFSGVSHEELDGVEKMYFDFIEFFRIPVLENDFEKIHVERRSENSISYGSGGGLAEEGEDKFNLGALSVLTEDQCYFTFDTHTVRGEIVDTSYIPGGYGIYAFRYDEDDMRIFDEGGSELAMVYPLDPEVMVEGFFANREESELLLFTTEDEVCMLTVIDVATMETKQRVEISRTDDTEGEECVGMHSIEIHEDFLTLRTYRGEIAVITWDEEDYTLEFAVPANLNPEDSRTVALPHQAVFAWDGEKLAACGILYDFGTKYGLQTCGFKLTVYDKTGMLFCGDYDCSLYTPGATRYSCQIIMNHGDTVGYTAKWDGK